VEIERLGCKDIGLDEYLRGYSSPSQYAFEHSDQFQTLLAGGVGCGKNHSLNKRAIALSTMEPDNEGLIARYTSAELESSTKKQFFEEVPAQVILHYSKSEDCVVLRTGDPNHPSKIWFRHIWEPRPDKKHLAGMNLGWIGGDQVEDWEEARWNDVMARFRRSSVRMPYMFGIINPKGHDWCWRRWIKPAEDSGAVHKVMVPSVSGGLVPSSHYRAGAGLYAIVAQTEENFFNGRCSDHPGHAFGCEACRQAAAEYVARLRRYNPPAWVKRMVDSSFDEWVGRIYPYDLYSAHNIDSFALPDDWRAVVPIDVGGDAPWAIPVLRVDSAGDVFVVSEFYKPSVLVSEIAAWIKDPAASWIPDWKKARYIIDPENKLAMVELAQHGIYCEAARKGPKLPGILQVAGYMHRMPGRVKTIPAQRLPDGSFGALVVPDAPRIWVFRDRCDNWRREHDAWQWHRDRRTGEATDRPEDKDDHQADATIYGFRVLPPVWELPEVDPQIEALKRLHYASYRESEHRTVLAGKGKPVGGVGEMWQDHVWERLAEQDGGLEW
jgi:hypothetical protein